MLKSRLRVFAMLGLSAVVGLTFDRDVRAASAVLTLGNPTVTATTATFELGLSFAGDPGDALTAIQLSVVGSSDELTQGGTDYSRFSFLPGLADWSSTSFEPGGFSLVFSGSPASDLPPTSLIVFGSLVVDLTGIDPAAILKVSLSGGSPGLDSTIASGIVAGSFVDSFSDPNELSLSLTPGEVTFRAIPEPSSWILGAIGLVLGIGACRQSRSSKRKAG